MHTFLKLIWIASIPAWMAASAAQDQVSTVHLNHGELSVTFRDNSESPGVLSGIDQLFNTAAAADFDAYDPDGRGASAGLNFEHIISGHRNPNNKFTPRHGPYTLRSLPNSQSVVLTRRAEDSLWKVASTLTYTLSDPHSIDFEFRCTPEDASLFGRRGYGIFFFANYMNDVEDVALHFRGLRSADAEEEWIRAEAPKGHPHWNGGGNYRAVDAEPLQYDDDVEFRLNTWSYDWPRIAKPFYFGRAARGMTLILMFDRLHTERDQIRFSLYKFKLPKHPRPAWDFQYVINKVQAGEEYGFRGRLVWKKFVSAEDCRDEYERWFAAINTERQTADRVRQLKRLGATVFSQGNHVVEVNANRTQLTNEDLRLVSDFTRMTDLSLEETATDDSGLAQLSRLQRLEWLNLYRTKIGDEGLNHVSKLRRLQHLPVGETNVTDAGLAHLSNMTGLLYLGLRGNNVTDKGLEHLRQLVQLTGLHLGNTRVTDDGLTHLSGMTGLQNLWLDETAVSDKAIPVLAKLRSLRELHIRETRITGAGVEQLATLLPECHIDHDH